MLYDAPPHESGRIGSQLAELDRLQAELGRGVDQPRPWVLPLRRQESTISWVSSIRIEGFKVTEDRAGKLAAGEAQPEPGNENEQAFTCYAQAMEHVATLAVDPLFRWLDRVILDLHFEACRFQRNRKPGLLRTGPIAVTSPDGGTAYVAPDANLVPDLLAELIESIKRMEADGVHPAVIAAMAHLNLVSIHPFEDGNGRISRILQSLVLARDGVLTPELGSIEPWLAEHTAGYYEILMRVQGGRFQPEREADPWVQFCLQAHLAQAKRRLALMAETAERWERLERLIAGKGWSDRLVIALEQALHGSSGRQAYSSEAGIAPVTASGDFRRLTDAGLLEQSGQGRSTAYVPTAELRKLIG